jgi:hypothetical protein
MFVIKLKFVVSKLDYLENLKKFREFKQFKVYMGKLMGNWYSSDIVQKLQI